MKITKEAQGGQTVAVTAEEMNEINRLSRRELKREEVYTFSVRLCDNEVDRDHERFSRETLEQLAQLFQGKSGIFDHNWSAKGQAARIYRTQVVEEPGSLAVTGEPCAYLKGYAYMMRTQENAGLIAEIEAGIKKEVSVGCSVKRAVCSICGEDMTDCPHRKGEEYEGKLCFAELREATDAYEFSFVAVPAQPRAGIMKGKENRARSLKELCEGEEQCVRELKQLEREAELGRHYLSALRRDVVRLGALSGDGMKTLTLEKIAGKLEEEELLELKDSFERRAAGKYPVMTQLGYGNVAPAEVGRDKEFMI